MGSCVSSDLQESEDRTRRIDRMIRSDEKRRTKQIKLLLLGAGGSGKSTVLKQMRLIHSVVFTEDELRYFRFLLYTNILEGFKVVFAIAEERGLSLSKASAPVAEALLEYYAQLAPWAKRGPEPFPSQVKEAVTRLWVEEPVIRNVLAIGGIGCPDNLEYLMENIERYWEPEFVATHDDILRTRAKTTGIVETSFPVGDMTYNIVDVGGQRSERRKWLQCFDNVDAVIFLVSLSGYDECLVEDRDANCMQESIMLFDQLLTSPTFAHTPFVLFLNKVDLFDAKVVSPLHGHPISAFFPQYPRESEGDPEFGREFFRSKYVRLHKRHQRRRKHEAQSGRAGTPGPGSGGGGAGEKAERATAGRLNSQELYVHYTTATDTSSMKKVMEAVKDTMAKRTLADMSIL